MLNLSIKDRDMIVHYLKNVTVPAEVGGNLMQIATILSGLPEVKESAPTPEEKPAKKK